MLIFPAPERMHAERLQTKWLHTERICREGIEIVYSGAQRLLGLLFSAGQKSSAWKTDQGDLAGMMVYCA